MENQRFAETIREIKDVAKKIGEFLTPQTVDLKLSNHIRRPMNPDTLREMGTEWEADRQRVSEEQGVFEFDD